MNMMEKLEEYVFWLVTSVTTALAFGVTWLIRTVFTNQAQVEILKNEFAHRDKLRAEDREAMEEMRENVSEIRNVLMNGGRKDR